jgi:hypothetical protein
MATACYPAPSASELKGAMLPEARRVVDFPRTVRLAVSERPTRERFSGKL